MADNKEAIIYTLEFCPKCEVLKEYFKGNGISYSERDMSSAESLTDLRVSGVFVTEAPVLRKDTRFLTSTDMFEGDSVRGEVVKELLEGS
jgi:glutaredoxin